MGDIPKQFLLRLLRFQDILVGLFQCFIQLIKLF